ncbi:MAG: helix-turn-helix domain-containing protein [Planctomycetes bacterium]|nr:helix-turn-helix domain-containing protein [Planctomycetota bacterium]
MTRRPQIALLVETSNAYARGLLHGIVRYIREHRPWSIHLPELGRGDRPPSWFEGWSGHGIIARIENRRIAQAVLRSGLPAVDVSAARLVPQLPWVETNDQKIARLAADHLLERGFKHFAFCGDDRFNWSRWRCEHFVECIKNAGGTCDVHTIDVDAAPKQQDAALARWMRRLPKPVGVMACFDIRGQQVLDACRRLGVAVPDEVAVVGVDNDELLCDLADPPLSSVIPDAHRTGYAAASLLDRMMSGSKVKAEATLIDPVGLVTRQSTDVLAIDDRDVSAAVRYIREHACEGIGVNDVLAAVPLSRRVLEARFKKLVGRTPHEQILRTQLARVQELLRETNLPLTTIADRAGFKHAEYLSVVFKKHLGVPPSQYRAQSGR